MGTRWWMLLGASLVVGCAVMLTVLVRRPAYPVPPAPPAADDAYGDPLPAFARARIGRVRHPRTGWRFAIEPDGKRVVTIPSDGLVHVVDAATGGVVEEVRLWEPFRGHMYVERRGLAGGKDDSREGPRNRVTVKALSGDGSRLAAVVGNDVAIWDLPAAKPAVTHAGLGTHTQALAFSSDGKRLGIARTSGGAGAVGHVAVIDCRSATEVHRTPHSHPIGIAFSRDGSTLGILGASLAVVEIATGAVRFETVKRQFANRHVALSSDASLVASAERADLKSPTAVVVRDAATGGELWRAEVGDQALMGLAFSPDDELLAVSGRPGSVHDARTGVVVFAPHEEELTTGTFQFGPDGKRLFGSRASRLHVWDVGSWKALLAERTQRAPPRGGIVDFRWFASGDSLATLGRHGVVSVWAAATGALELEMESGADQPVQLAVSADGSQAMVGPNPRFGNGRKLASVIDLDARRAGEPFLVPLRRRIAFLDGEAVLFERGRGKGPVVRAARAAHALRTLAADDNAISGAEVSTDGRTIAALSGGRIHVWDMATGTLRPGFPTGEANLVALSPDGDDVVSWRGGPLQVRATHDGTLRMEVDLRGTLGSDAATAVSPDGRFVAFAGMTHFFDLWAIDEMESVYRFAGHTADVTRLAFSPDGRTIASSSRDGTLLLWDLSPWLDDE